MNRTDELSRCPLQHREGGPVGEEGSSRRDEPDPELVDIFLEEATEILESCDASLQRIQGRDRVDESVSELKRSLHTLKGSARMAGFSGIGELSHSVESLLSGGDRDQRWEPRIEILALGIDRVRTMIDAVSQATVPASPDQFIQEIEQFRLGRHCEVLNGARGRDSDSRASDPDMERESRHSSPPEAGPSDGRSHSPDQSECPDGSAESVSDVPNEIAPKSEVNPAEGALRSSDMIRVRSDMLDEMVNLSGEINNHQARFQLQLADTGFGLDELGQTIERLRGQLRKLEMETEAQILYRHESESFDTRTDFDPLELDRYSTMQQLSRSLSESVEDLVNLKDLLRRQTADAGMLLEQQARVSAFLQERIMRTRMVRFSTIMGRLRSIVRQTATELEKNVAMTSIGEDSELDRSVLNGMTPAIEHIIRNAIAHGIEHGPDRRRRGKADQGRIELQVAREGSEVVIQIEDDGAGIDRAAVGRKAMQMGLVQDTRGLSDDDLLQFILEPGFSTAQSVTQVSGRGVGMDVVHSEVKRLGGVLSVDSRAGGGTRFSIRLPYTLALTEVIVLGLADELYAIPLANFEGIVRVDSDSIQQLYADARPAYDFGGNRYELAHLGSLLGSTPPAFGVATSMCPVVLIRAGDRRMALHVDVLAGKRDVVTKPVGALLESVNGISGATILGDGSVVLVLDVTGLYWLNSRWSRSDAVAAGSGPQAVDARRTVMVVDDSITIRKVTSRLLMQNNYAVTTAKDGVDALQQLGEVLPDLILLDIEMPRMDGFELATHIRNSQRLRGVPVIMITSRTGEKHKSRAMNIGVDHYLGKPYQESELLATIRGMLEEGAGD